MSHPTKHSSNAAKLPARVTELAKPWSLDDALPTNSPAAQFKETKPTPATKRASSKSEAQKQDLGRLPLSGSGGSFGVETETKMKSLEFPDGRRVPGVDSSRHQPPSYFGLSISVPTEK